MRRDRRERRKKKVSGARMLEKRKGVVQGAGEEALGCLPAGRPLVSARRRSSLWISDLTASISALVSGELGRSRRDTRKTRWSVSSSCSLSIRLTSDPEGLEEVGRDAMFRIPVAHSI